MCVHLVGTDYHGACCSEIDSVNVCDAVRLFNASALKSECFQMTWVGTHPRRHLGSQCKTAEDTAIDNRGFTTSYGLSHVQIDVAV